MYTKNLLLVIIEVDAVWWWCGQSGSRVMTEALEVQMRDN